MNNSNYNADSIQILSDLDHIRLNPGMYIGEMDTPHHLLQECIDNALDETINGFSNGFEVYIFNNSGDITYRVVDHGRGIPCGTKEVNGKEISILEALTTKSNSGGKFDNKNYLNSTGLHGLGLKCVNALADNLTIISVNDNKIGHLECYEGEPVEPVVYKATKDKSGTSIGFTIKKDNKYFENNEIPLEFIVNKLNTYQAFSIKNIKLYVDNEDVTTKYLNAITPFDLHKHPMDNNKYAIQSDIEVENSVKEKLRFSFQYVDNTSTSYKFNGYTNYLYNKDGGGHILAAQDALIGAFKLFCEKRNITVPSTMASDYFIGLNAIVSCNIIHKAFASQTKDKLVTGTGTTRDYFKELTEKLANAINEQVFEKCVGITKALIQRISDYRKERENKKELKGLSQYITINQSEGSTVRRCSVYEKLTECSSKNRDECELIMTEGDSASGGLIRTRDKKTVAILPLRGKIKNVVGCTVTDILKNKEIAGIISSVGAGILDKCNIEKRRYSDIIYAGDADVDGAHITNLVIALFVTMMPNIVKSGHLKLVLSPLYGYKDKNGEWQGAFKFEDMPKDIQKSGKFERYKGLGSLDDEQVKEFLLNKNKRKLVTVNYPTNIDEFNYIMSTSEGRRSLLSDCGLLQE